MLANPVCNKLIVYLSGSATDTVGQHSPPGANPVSYDGADQITLEEVGIYLRRFLSINAEPIIC